MKNLTGHLLFPTLILIALFAFVTNASTAEIDDFKNIVRSAAQSTAGLKRCSDEMDRAVNSMVSDTTFATGIFKAATSGNASALQSIYAQKTPSCSVQVSSLEKDFGFRLSFGDPTTGNHFFICFVSRNHPVKCTDGTRADIEITIK